MGQFLVRPLIERQRNEVLRPVELPTCGDERALRVWKKRCHNREGDEVVNAPTSLDRNSDPSSVARWLGAECVVHRRRAIPFEDHARGHACG